MTDFQITSLVGYLPDGKTVVKVAGVALFLIPQILVLGAFFTDIDTVQTERTVVDSYTVTEGEDHFQSIELDFITTEVELSQRASNIGITKAYLYVGGEKRSQKSIDPHQSSFEFTATAHLEEFDVLLVNGNNAVVSRVHVTHGAETHQGEVL